MEPSYGSVSDQELARMAASGDREAFRELHRRYQGLIFARACRLLGDRSDAEDVLQQTFMVALDKLAAGKYPDNFGGWLQEILKRTVWLLIARRKRWKIFQEKLVHLGDFWHKLIMEMPGADEEDWRFVFDVLEQTVPRRVGKKVRPIAEFMFQLYRESGSFPSVRAIGERFDLGHGTAERWRELVIEACKPILSAHGLSLDI